eukprot:CAMPEP_0118959108 /NCGR_PEP_ID=MMETSP1169-20130426/62962_1 /TAXON_ID=36882 /ORGANISM="Pyramimonas obovata, Strain CCMP722" /LENGTH=459 /DNA_ID=CAMNT_0006907235 /DNA_START=412 /DNA_END=1791 /DNA_ORIENTATION=+
MFGAASAPAFGGFGAPAFGAGPSAFGAAPAAFGQTTSAPAGFSGFGAPASSAAGLFSFPGASSAAAATSGFNFGAPASTAGFASAAASTSAFGFGTPAASSTSLFGAPASSISALGGGLATSAGMFGAASTSSLFGASGALGGGGSAGMFGSGLFGASTTGSLFGSSTGSTAGASTSLFGMSAFGAPSAAPCPSCGTQAAHHAAPAQDLPSQELATIDDSYNPDPQNSRYRFRALFYNVVDDPNQKQKPLGVDEVRWRESLAAIGGPNNAERLWPVQASGFSDLEARLNQQEKTIVDDQQFLESIRHLFRQSQRQRETTTRERINRLREKHQGLQHFLLRIMAKVSALEGLSRQMSGVVISNAPGEAVRHLHKLRDDMQRSTSSLPRRTTALAAAVQNRERCDSTNPASSNGRISEESIASMRQLLAQQTAAMGHLAEVVKRDLRDISIMEKERANQAL